MAFTTIPRTVITDELYFGHLSHEDKSLMRQIHGPLNGEHGPDSYESFQLCISRPTGTPKYIKSFESTLRNHGYSDKSFYLDSEASYLLEESTYDVYTVDSESKHPTENRKQLNIPSWLDCSKAFPRLGFTKKVSCKIIGPHNTVIEDYSYLLPNSIDIACQIIYIKGCFLQLVSFKDGAISSNSSLVKEDITFGPDNTFLFMDCRSKTFLAKQLIDSHITLRKGDCLYLNGGTLILNKSDALLIDPLMYADILNCYANYLVGLVGTTDGVAKEYLEKKSFQKKAIDAIATEIRDHF